jgi:hypothetical protein
MGFRNEGEQMKVPRTMNVPTRDNTEQAREVLSMAEYCASVNVDIVSAQGCNRQSRHLQCPAEMWTCFFLSDV